MLEQQRVAGGDHSASVLRSRGHLAGSWGSEVWTHSIPSANFGAEVSPGDDSAPKKHPLVADRSPTVDGATGVSAILQRLAIRPGSGCDLAGAGLATHSATSVARAGARYHGDSYVQILPYIEQDALFKAT
jgi:hypothetical protein